MRWSSLTSSFTRQAWTGWAAKDREGKFHLSPLKSALKRNIIYLSQERKTERKKEREGGRKETEVPVKKTVLVSVMWENKNCLGR